MKKHFINFLKAFCAYDEFMEAFIATNKFFDFDYFIKYTEPNLYLAGAFTSKESKFSSQELSELYIEWHQRLKQINHESNT